MNPPLIRTAAPNDASAIADLSAQLGYPTSVAQAAHRLTVLLDSSDHAVLVACLADGSVVGWVHVFQALRVESGAFAELGGFVVAEPQRGRGVGRALLTVAEEWVRQQRIAKLRVRTRADRSDAHAFFRRLGFSLTKEQHIYDKELGTDA